MIKIIKASEQVIAEKDTVGVFVSAHNTSNEALKSMISVFNTGCTVAPTIIHSATEVDSYLSVSTSGNLTITISDFVAYYESIKSFIEIDEVEVVVDRSVITDSPYIPCVYIYVSDTGEVEQHLTITESISKVLVAVVTTDRIVRVTHRAMTPKYIRSEMVSNNLVQSYSTNFTTDSSSNITGVTYDVLYEGISELRDRSGILTTPVRRVLYYAINSNTGLPEAETTHITSTKSILVARVGGTNGNYVGFTMYYDVVTGDLHVYSSSHESILKSSVLQMLVLQGYESKNSSTLVPLAKVVFKKTSNSGSVDFTSTDTVVVDHGQHEAYLGEVIRSALVWSDGNPGSSS